MFVFHLHHRPGLCSHYCSKRLHFHQQKVKRMPDSSFHTHDFDHVLYEQAICLQRKMRILPEMSVSRCVINKQLSGEVSYNVKYTQDDTCKHIFTDTRIIREKLEGSAVHSRWVNAKFWIKYNFYCE